MAIAVPIDGLGLLGAGPSADTVTIMFGPSIYTVLAPKGLHFCVSPETSPKPQVSNQINTSVVSRADFRRMKFISEEKK